VCRPFQIKATAKTEQTTASETETPIPIQTGLFDPSSASAFVSERLSPIGSSKKGLTENQHS
jgi:hypothetical protein